MRVAMVGPGLDVPGGMTQVHRSWMRAKALRGVQVDYFETMSELPPARWALKNAACQAKWVAALATGYRPDVVHVHVADGTSFWRKLLYIEQADKAGLPTVAHLHGAWMEDFYAESARNRWAVKRMFRTVDLVMPLHGRAAAKVKEWAGPDVPVEVLYNPTVVEEFDPLPDRSAPTETPTVLMMGVLDERKGPYDLAAAMPAILDRVPGTRFVFGGNGDLAEMERRCRDVGAWDHVTLLGWVKGEQKLQAFRDADIYCLPSHFENLPVSIIEAMAAGLPVVSTDIAGVPEEVIDGETGFVVPPRDPAMLGQRLAALCEDVELRVQMGAAGRARAEQHFDNEVVVARLVELWRGVAGRG